MQQRALVCSAGGRLCALPLAHVRETMRPLPVMPISNAPHFVRGLAQIRGASLPVVDLAKLLGDSDEQASRFVTIAVGTRNVALAVGVVHGVRAIEAAHLEQLPPLLSDLADVVIAIGRLDAELLLVLSSMQLLSALPEENTEVPS
jgi:purine-binding chemotaxis protein CheW